MSISEQVKYDQLVHICDQLSQHQYQLITKRQSLQEREAQHIKLTEKLKQLQTTIQQRPQVKSKNFNESLNSYNDRMQGLENDIQFDKQQQKMKKAQDQQDIQRCIVNLSSLELKFRAGKSGVTSPRNSQKQIEKVISQLSRTIQRKQLKLKELRIIAQRYDLKNIPQDYHQQKLDQAYTRELTTKIRALQAHIDQLKFKKEQELKAKINEIQTQIRGILQQTKQVKTTIHTETVNRLYQQLEQLKTEHRQLKQGNQQNKQAMVQIHKQTQRLMQSLQQIQGQTKFLQQDQVLEGLRQRNVAERQQLNFVEIATSNIHKDLNAANEQASRYLDKLLGPDNSQSAVDVRRLRAQLDDIKRLSDECHTDLKVNFVPSNVIEQTKRLITVEESAIKQIQVISREREQVRVSLSNAIRALESLRNKPLHYIESLKRAIDDQENTIVKVTRQIIEMRDKIQQMRTEYNITTEQSISSQPDELPEFMYQPPSTKKPDLEFIPDVPEFVPEEHTLEEYIGNIIFSNAIPKHRKTLTELIIGMVLVPSCYVLVSIILQ